MSERKVRMGIDVGGTHTKAVAIDLSLIHIYNSFTIYSSHVGEWIYNRK